MRECISVLFKGLPLEMSRGIFEDRYICIEHLSIINKLYLLYILQLTGRNIGAFNGYTRMVDVRNYILDRAVKHEIS